MIDTIPKEIIQKAKFVKLLILDVDGVLTDGKLFFDLQGNEYKSFHARDGHGIVLLQESGVQVAIISGRKSPIVEKRMKDLGVKHIYQGYKNKFIAFDELVNRCHIVSKEQVAFVGDDLIDLPIMMRVGLGIVVADANFALKQHADWCCVNKGGEGAVREVCDLIMQAQNTFEDMIKLHL